MAKLGRPTKPLISKENAIRVALDVIDEQGLEALSLERVAKRIGVRAPSLYHHFHNKAELLTEIARSILQKVAVPPNEEAPWEEQFMGLCLATRSAILQHPRAGLLLLQYFPRTLLVSAYDYWTAKCPYPVEVQMLIMDGAEKLTFGSAFFAAAAATYTTPVMPDFSAARYPSLAAAVERNPHDDEALFEETIRVFLAGLRVRYGAHAETVAAPKRKAVAKAPAKAKAAAAKAEPKVKAKPKTKTAAKPKSAPRKTAARK